MSTWSAAVRYVEVDGQGVVFNAHYLTYCDEALAAYGAQRGLGDLAERVRLKTSTLTWSAPLVHGDEVAVSVTCEAVGRTSLTLVFEIASRERVCCEVRTVYVLTDDAGDPQEIGPAPRAALLASD